MKKIIFILALIFMTVASIAQQSHLVLSLPMDGNLYDTIWHYGVNGDTLHDGIAHGYGVNDSMFVSDRFGVPHKALYLGGGTPQNWILIDTSASLLAAAQGDITMAFWYKFAVRDGYIFHMNYYDPQGVTTGYEFCPTTQTPTGGDTVIHMRDKQWNGDLVDLYHNDSIVLNTWYFVCGTIKDRGFQYPDSARYCYKLYVNGLEADSIYGRDYRPCNPGMNKTILELGRNCGGFPNGFGYAKGTIDQVDIYNFAMTDDEIDSLWLSSTTAPTLVHQPSGFVPSTLKSPSTTYKTFIEASGYCAENGLHYAWYKVGDNSTILSTTNTLKGVSASDTTCRYYCKIMNKYNTTYSDTTLGNPNNPCGIYTGVHENTSNPTIEIYPNPTTGNVTIKSSEPVQVLYIINLLGAEVAHTVPNSNDYNINISYLPTGVYYFRTQINGVLSTHKVIKN